MDMMELRFRMMAMIGGSKSVWKQKQITAQQDYSVASDVISWIASEMPTTQNAWIVKDNPKKSSMEFIGTEIVGGVQTYYFYWNSYLRASGVNSQGISTNVTKDDAFTIFYQ